MTPTEAVPEPAAERPPRQPAGALIAGRYRIDWLLGTGGSAEVYQATDTRLGRDVALKVFCAHVWDDHGDARFREEVRLLSGLAHRCLLPVLDAETDAPPWFLVLPLIDGTTLARRIPLGPCEPETARRIGAAVGEALAYLHAHDIVHRDVKPSNVLIGRSARADRVFLTDFGIAYAADSPHPTADGHLVGTPGYLAPELVDGRRATPASDVYSLGLMLLEALTGHCEYPGTPLQRAVAGAVRPPQIPEWIDAEWQWLLRRLTAAEPESRPSAASAAVLLADGRSHLPSGRRRIGLGLGRPHARRATSAGRS